MVGIQVTMPLLVLGVVLTSVQPRPLTQFRISSKYDWYEAGKICPGDGYGMLVEMKTFDKDRPCPPYDDIDTDDEFRLKARFQGSKNGVDKMLKDGKWASYYIIGCCYM